ncbi:DNA polymerase zeta catalytic subunit [Phanerochaete sordida]|uniref:DNA polymerase n=1 Tax=Phanerochaete sordida TaxID=48140 RepID=A0A9P3L9M3_9APHY|nr:DNA polymerase zeta catalytic subunit [Phanerochaete sordida]
MNDQEPNLRIRVNQIDYIVEPAGPLDNTALPRVPVLRIYGESSAGKKACLHVHQVYPYFFVEYDGQVNPDNVNKHIARMSHSLNHAIALSLKRNPNSPNSQFVRAVVLVKGVHFYGFHASYSPFLKVHIADPALMNRAVTLMRSGTVMKTRFRIYESHLSFPLQFMCDFGLYGCGWIDLAEVWARGLDEDEDEPQFSCLPSPYYRQTRMPLELDVAAHQILNRHKLAPRNFNHKLTIPSPPLPDEPVVLSVRELWEDERRRRAERGLSPSPPMPKDPSAESRDPGGGWSAEARWWDEFRKRLEQAEPLPPFTSEEEPWARWVTTTFESVEALWEEEHRAWRPRWSGQNSTEDKRDEGLQKREENPFEAPATGKSSQPRTRATEADVDETILSSQELSSLVEHEELEWAQRQEDIIERDDVAEAERAAEDGAPPEPEYEEQATPVKPRDKQGFVPGTPSSLRQVNPFNDAWGRLPVDEQDSGEESESSQTLSSPTLRTQSPAFLGPVVDLSAENPFLDESLRKAETGELLDRTPYLVKPRSFFQPADNYGDEGTLGSDISAVAFADLPETPRPHKRRKLDLLDVHTPTTSASQAAFISKGTPFPRATPRTLRGARTYEYHLPPPTTSALLESLEAHDIPAKVYKDPFYSNEDDAPEHTREYAGLLYDLKGGTGIGVLQEWEGHETFNSGLGKLDTTGIYGWEYAGVPPSVKQTRLWLDAHQVDEAAKPKHSSQIIGPTQVNRFGMKASPPTRPVARDKGGMTALSIEVFAPSREGKLPDPGLDEAVAVFYALYDSNYPRADHTVPFQCENGILVLEKPQLDRRRLRNCKFEVLESELDLINRVVDLVQDLDPDILVGWDVQAGSWGYLSARAGTFGLDFGEQISRAPGRAHAGQSEQWGLRTTSTFRVIGRHVLNLWRIMRSELSLSSYSMENAVFHVLGRRTPRYSAGTLTEWFHSETPEHASRLLQYCMGRATMVVEMLEVAEVIAKNSEFARVFGVDFFSVLSRGSQFKVESFMFRIAKPESFVLLSPSKEDVGKQNAAECMPLIMEPLSAFYSSPLVVLDFQSLYPSCMIAYNYCYSTCLGRVVNFKGQNKFGVSELHTPPELLDTLKDYINISPNGMIFVKPVVRKGLLGRMLTELLDTRVMVKSAMKLVKDDKALSRVLEARQLSLKFIANVTYGYTSATFSGRMPAVEIADAIVQTGRETLEKAIRLIDSTPKWGAKVVYGDTDSLFIYLRGKTKEQAFRIGQDIADTVTATNPAPIKLKFEKVYLPCVLLAKKRYVGFKYESPDEQEPGFDAKGIETVRRDGVPAQQKMVETCLKILFRTQDLSKVKDYCCTTWAQILENRVSLQDLIFAKEVRLGTYSTEGPPPPGVAVATRRMLEDANDEAQYGDRVPYVVVRGAPGARLVDRALAPAALLADAQQRPDAHYYIARVLVPPLARVFALVGADVRAWFDEMPRAHRADAPEAARLLTPRRRAREQALLRRFKIDEHFLAARCLTCGAATEEESTICDTCCFRPQETIGKLLAKVHRTEQRLTDVHRVCASCAGTPQAEPVRCESLDCPWLFERKKLEHKAEGLQAIHGLVEELEELHLDEGSSTVAGDIEEQSGGEVSTCGLSVP